MKTTILVLAMAALASWGAVSSLSAALDVPQVHFSHATQECVRVVDKNGKRECPEELPAKYERVWVQ